jgi:hypothetical protein
VRDPRSADSAVPDRSGPQDGGRASGLRRPQRGDMPVRGRPPPGNRLAERGSSPKPRRLPEGSRLAEARGTADRGEPGPVAGRSQVAGPGPYELARRPQAGRIPGTGRIPQPRPPGARRPPDNSRVPRSDGISVPRSLPERHRTLEVRLPEAISARLRDARNVFGVWRRTRPFWGGLSIICGASEILLSEHGPLQVAIHIGAKGLAGYIVPVMLLLCGILLWFNPAQRAYNSLFAMALALLSWITSNLGGFFIGMLLSLVGGALAFAWTPDSERQPPRRTPSTPQIRRSSRARALTLRPVAALPPPAPVKGSLEAAAPALPPPRKAVLSEYGCLSAIFTDRRPRS